MTSIKTKKVAAEKYVVILLRIFILTIKFLSYRS